MTLSLFGNYSNSRFRSLFQKIFFLPVRLFFYHSLPSSFAFFDANRVQLHVDVCKVSGKKNTAQLCCSGYFSFRHTVPCRLLRAALPLHHEKGKTGGENKQRKRRTEKRKNGNKYHSVSRDYIIFVFITHRRSVQ